MEGPLLWFCLSILATSSVLVPSRHSTQHKISAKGHVVGYSALYIDTTETQAAVCAAMLVFLPHIFQDHLTHEDSYTNCVH